MVTIFNPKSAHFIIPPHQNLLTPQNLKNTIENVTPLWSIQSWKCDPIQVYTYYEEVPLLLPGTSGVLNCLKFFIS